MACQGQTDDQQMYPLRETRTKLVIPHAFDIIWARKGVPQGGVPSRSSVSEGETPATHSSPAGVEPVQKSPPLSFFPFSFACRLLLMWATSPGNKQSPAASGPPRRSKDAVSNGQSAGSWRGSPSYKKETWEGRVRWLSQERSHGVWQLAVHLQTPEYGRRRELATPKCTELK